MAKRPEHRYGQKTQEEEPQRTHVDVAPALACLQHAGRGVHHYGRTPTARDATMTMVKSEIMLSIIISIFARRVSGKASVGLNAVAVLYARKR